jgi:amidase
MDPFLPAWRLAELTRGRHISCLELLDLYLLRCERLNPQINAIILRDADRARARARALDAVGPDGSGPLYGVPMTVKESFDRASDHLGLWLPPRSSRRRRRAGGAAYRGHRRGRVR